MEKQYKQITVITHQGVTITFARINEPDAIDIYYNILDLKVDSTSDDMDWTGFRKLDLPEELRPVGMSLINVDTKFDPSTMIADTAFKAVSDQSTICLFQQSSKGTLLVNRFMMKTQAPKNDTASVGPVLEPVWEVRFERSAKQDIPSGPKDTQNYQDPLGDPFIEPTLELSMINSLADGRFDVMLIPNSETDSFNWQFFAYNNSTAKIDLFSFPMDENGLFDLIEKTLDNNLQIPPDASFDLKEKTDGDPADLSFVYAPSATLYYKQERVQSKSGESKLIERNARVMLSLPVTPKDENEEPVRVATVDFSISKSGHLSGIQSGTVLEKIAPSNDTLEFYENSYVKLPNNQSALSIKGSFKLSAWIYPDGNPASDLLILGGDQSAAPKDRAPYLRLIEGAKIQAGFGNGTEASWCLSSALIAPEKWFKVTVSYHAESGEYQMMINDEQVPVTTSETKGTPTGAPITQISAPDNGMTGKIDLVRIYTISNTQESLVGEWKFDTVNYNATPPTTPDASEYKNDGRLFGPKLVPSNSPIESNTSGVLQIDDQGMSTYTGLLDFIHPTSSPYLYYGSDGYLHLYFQGAEDVFSVAVYDVESSRSIFSIDWLAKASETESETGSLDLVSSKAGTYMNAADITVESGAGSGLLHLTIDNKKGRKETWKGIPERMPQLISILNGDFSYDPNDPQLKTGKKVFFDVYGKYPACRIPVQANVQDNALVFLSRLETVLPLHSVAFKNKTENDIQAILTFLPPKWNNDNDQVLITQTWSGVPVRASLFVETLNGSNPAYDYSSTDSVNTTIYHIHALTVPSNEQNSTIQLLTSPGVSDFAITVKDSSDKSVDACDVSIILNDGTSLSGEWKNVPRDQNKLAAIIDYSPEGQAIYDYEANATGSYKEIGANILAITDGLSATVENHTPSPDDISDMLAITSIFQLYNDGSAFSDEEVDNQSPMMASILQSGSYASTEDEIEAEQVFLTSGSTLVGAVAGNHPTNGGVPIVQPTTSFTNGTANLSVNGLNGGWINESPRFGLDFNGLSYLSYDTGNQNIDKLAIAGDMSTELWVKPDPAQNAGEFQRLYTFNKTGNPYYPDERFQYMLGLERSYCITFTENTSVKADYILTSDGATFQCWINPSSLQDGQIMALGTIGIYQKYMTLELSGGELLLTYGDNASVKGGTLSTGKWMCVAGSVKDNEQDTSKVDIALYLNGVLQNQAKVDKIDLGEIGAFTVGDINSGVAMMVNGASLWDKTLDAQSMLMAANLNVVEYLGEDLMIYIPFTEGQGFNITNQAPNGPAFTNEIKNLPNNPWVKTGIYFIPYTANKGYAFIAEGLFIPASWHHLSTVYRSGFSLEFNGSDTADCGNNQSLNVDDNFSLECWITPEVTNRVQTLLCKEGTYQLQIESNNKVSFAVYTSEGLITVTSDQRVSAGEPAYIAATFSTGPVKGQQSEEPEDQKYKTQASLYVNTHLKSKSKDDYTESVSVENTEAALLMAVNGTEGNRYAGEMSDVRFWGRELSKDDVSTVFTTHKIKNDDGLVSYWRFNEQQGKVAYDANGINNAKITSNELWELYPPNSSFTLYVNGRPVTQFTTIEDLSPYGGYGKEQFQLCALLNDSSAQQNGFLGEMDDIRFWDIELTGEQLSDNMYRTLSGREEGIVGYWKIDTGSGAKAEDFSGNQNVGAFMPSPGGPLWTNSDAPINEEAKEVFNILGGVSTLYEQSITSPPAVVEYADTQQDAYGNIFSVMKRCYVSLKNGYPQLVTGYKVGDLDTVYLGQVQTKPTVIGFIEGAPPVPSENQTMPFWAGDISELFIYTEGTYTQLNKVDETMRLYAAGNQRGTGISLATQAGIFLSTNAAVSFGLGAETQFQTYSFEGHLGVQSSQEFQSGEGGDTGFSQGKSNNITDLLTPGGEWEPAPYLNPNVGRRFITDNQGYALVKSTTADLYIVTLKGRGSLVKYTVVPDPDIPEDVNIIDFPINPKYIKNGTVDGKVGLKNDPDFPNADEVRGSYFRPLEAYAIKREIERQESQLEAYYKQFNTKNYRNDSSLFGSSESGLTKLKEEAANNLSYDWEKKISKRNIVNTYVWTAGGGLHTEAETTMDSYSESYGAFESDSLNSGVHIDAAGAFVVGIYQELDALWDIHYEGSSTKTKEENDSFSLEEAVHTDWFLKKPIVEDGQLLGYEKNNAPGKVDAYRFNSFFLAPNQQNFQAFLGQVIDQNWLNNSQTANAVALREATSSENGVWRVMHRATFVSRVPPPFQPVNDESLSPDITPPANLATNTLFTRIIEMQIPEESRKNPSALQIGKAIDAVLGQDPQNPGVLGSLIPWWTTFLTAAQDIQNKAYLTLYELRVDTLDYMIQMYDTQRYDELADGQNGSALQTMDNGKEKSAAAKKTASGNGDQRSDEQKDTGDTLVEPVV